MSSCQTSPKRSVTAALCGTALMWPVWATSSAVSSRTRSPDLDVPDLHDAGDDDADE